MYEDRFCFREWRPYLEVNGELQFHCHDKCHQPFNAVQRKHILLMFFLVSGFWFIVSGKP